MTETPEPADPFDASVWHVEEAGFDPARTNLYETLFTVGNGRLGTRGSLDEGHLGQLSGTFLNGVYDRHDVPVSDLVNAPDWVDTAIFVDGVRLDVDTSGGALVRAAREGAHRSPAAARRLLTLTAGHVDDITGRRVMRAAQYGDEVARDAFGVVGTWLGTGMASLANVLDPAMFVIGGGVRAAGELLREPAVLAFEKNLTGWRRCAIPDVQLARFGPEAGIIGAADLARHRSPTRRRR